LSRGECGGRQKRRLSQTPVRADGDEEQNGQADPLHSFALLAPLFFTLAAMLRAQSHGQKLAAVRWRSLFLSAPPGKACEPILSKSLSSRASVPVVRCLSAGGNSPLPWPRPLRQISHPSWRVNIRFSLYETRKSKEIRRAHSENRIFTLAQRFAIAA
jgi:hypothetical protein